MMDKPQHHQSVRKLGWVDPPVTPAMMEMWVEGTGASGARRRKVNASELMSGSATCFTAQPPPSDSDTPTLRTSAAASVALPEAAGVLSSRLSTTAVTVTNGHRRCCRMYDTNMTVTVQLAWPLQGTHSHTHIHTQVVCCVSD